LGGGAGVGVRLGVRDRRHENLLEGLRCVVEGKGGQVTWLGVGLGLELGLGLGLGPGLGLGLELMLGLRQG